jgi:hypothetical protein
MRGECSEGWWKARSYHFAHFTKHFGTIAGMMDEAKRKTYSIRSAGCHVPNGL